MCKRTHDRACRNPAHSGNMSLESRLWKDVQILGVTFLLKAPQASLSALRLKVRRACETYNFVWQLKTCSLSAKRVSIREFRVIFWPPRLRWCENKHFLPELILCISTFYLLVKCAFLFFFLTTMRGSRRNTCGGQ